MQQFSLDSSYLTQQKSTQEESSKLEELALLFLISLQAFKP